MKKLIYLIIVFLICNYTSAQVANHLVIAEVYGGGGNGGPPASLLNDYVVLYNPTSSSVDLRTWSIQNARTGSSTWDVQPLRGNINASSYYYIQFWSAGPNGDTIQTGPNLVSTDSLASTSGKIALVDNQTPLTGIDPLPNSDIIDFVGYGATDAYETSPAPAPSNNSSIRRLSNSDEATYNINGSGWDTDNNSNDFYVQNNLTSNPPANQSAIADHPVIAEIYTNGGNGFALYQYDFLVLYNPTGSSIDLSTWSVQRENNNDGAWLVGDLSGSIDPNSYYLIQGASADTNGSPLPFPPQDTINNFNLSATSGKISLVNDQTLIEGMSDPNIVDFVGYGGANQYKGLATAPPPSPIQTVRRRDNNGLYVYLSNGHGWDTGDNQTDFYLQDNSTPPLPVELFSFSALLVRDEVSIKWETKTEVRNYGFEIERKSTSCNWQKIKFIEGHGNSNIPRSYSYLDNVIQPGTYYYRLKQIDTNGKFEYSKSIEISIKGLEKFDLKQNYPNPFNPVTIISFTVPERSNVQIIVYNILGQEVKTLVNEIKEAGNYSVSFDASKLNSGVYFYELKTRDFRQIKKMILMK